MMNEDVFEPPPKRRRLQRITGERPIGQVLRAAVVVAALGIGYGVVLALVRLESALDVFDRPIYSHAMLPSMIAGGLAVIAAGADVVRNDRVGAPALVFGLGLAAIISPFVAAYVVGVLALALVVAVLLSAAG